ncbi:MAG TPA: hypothetical protein VFI08_12870 [Spirochaetia bacterium]|nr:hypothetical protein [Spirochaetia bacterium]
MKRLLGLCVLLGASIALASCATAPASQAAGTGPAKWALYPAFGQFGLAIAANPPALVDGPVDLLLNAGKDVDLLVALTDPATRSPVGTLTPTRAGAQWKVSLAFPKSGEYDVLLLGKSPSDPGTTYQVLASAHFTARLAGAAAVAAAPAPDTVTTPAFDTYGLAFASPPVTKAGADTRLVIKRPKEFPISYGFQRLPGGDSCFDAIDVSSDASEIRVTIAFPATGDYRFTLYGKPSKDSPAEYEKLASVTWHATVDPSQVPSLPANWKPGPGFRLYGVTVTAAPEAAPGDVARIAFTTSKEITLAYSLDNNTTKKKTSDMPSDTIETSVDGMNCSAEVFFPENGEYELYLWGKTSAEKDYLQIGHLTFSVKVTDHTGALPANWQVSRRFWTYGITVSSPPGREVGDRADLVLNVPAGFDLSPNLQEKAKGTRFYTVAADASGTRQQVSVLFPACGEYDLVLWGKAATEKFSRELARVSFLSTFDESVPRYRLWRSNGSWPELPLGSVQSATTPWKPRGRWSELPVHNTGVLSADFAVPLGDTTVPLRKGTRVEFGRDEGQPLLEALAFPLPRDLPQKVEDTTVTFKAGSAFVVQSYGVAGVLPKDLKLTVAGVDLGCPKGSRLILDDGSVSEVELNGKGSLTLQKQSFECSGSVVVQGGSCSEETPSIVIGVTSKPAALKLGPASFTLPAQSLVALRKDGIDHVLVNQEISFTVNGVKKTVPAGWAVHLTDAGELVIYQPEE